MKNRFKNSRNRQNIERTTSLANNGYDQHKLRLRLRHKLERWLLSKIP